MVDNGIGNIDNPLVQRGLAMTTQVTVKAHCAPNKQVRITRTGQPDTIIQDGQSYDCVAYDEVKVTVREEPKPKPE